MASSHRDDPAEPEGSAGLRRSGGEDAYEEYLWGETPRAFARKARVGGPAGAPVRVRRISVDDLLRP